MNHVRMVEEEKKESNDIDDSDADRRRCNSNDNDSDSSDNIDCDDKAKTKKQLRFHQGNYSDDDGASSEDGDCIGSTTDNKNSGDFDNIMVAFQMQQLQASLAATVQQQQQQHLTPDLNSLQLNNYPTHHHQHHLGISVPNSNYAQRQPQAAASVVAQPQQQALAVMGMIHSNSPMNNIIMTSSTAATTNTNAHTVNAAITATANIPSSLLIQHHPSCDAIATNNAATASSLAPALLFQHQQQHLIATPPITTASSAQTLIIPHYIPPQPPSYGGQPLLYPTTTTIPHNQPLLSIQDHPLHQPIYNGINPHYPGVQLLNMHPPIYMVSNFLTPAECQFLIHAASDAFGPAPVVGRGVVGEVSPSRTSSTCYLAREDLPEYMRKIALLTGRPAEHCELPQVGRYYPSQQYLQHYDAFDLSNEDGIRFASNGGQRTVTVLTYLNDVPNGGTTFFPNLNVHVLPRRGMALVFFWQQLMDYWIRWRYMRLYLQWMLSMLVRFGFVNRIMTEGHRNDWWNR